MPGKPAAPRSHRGCCNQKSMQATANHYRRHFAFTALQTDAQLAHASLTVLQAPPPGSQQPGSQQSAAFNVSAVREVLAAAGQGAPVIEMLLELLELLAGEVMPPFWTDDKPSPEVPELQPLLEGVVAQLRASIGLPSQHNQQQPEAFDEAAQCLNALLGVGASGSPGAGSRAGGQGGKKGGKAKGRQQQHRPTATHGLGLGLGTQEGGPPPLPAAADVGSEICSEPLLRRIAVVQLGGRAARLFARLMEDLVPTTGSPSAVNQLLPSRVSRVRQEAYTSFPLAFTACNFGFLHVSRALAEVQQAAAGVSAALAAGRRPDAGNARILVAAIVSECIGSCATLLNRTTAAVVASIEGISEPAARKVADGWCGCMVQLTRTACEVQLCAARAPREGEEASMSWRSFGKAVSSSDCLVLLHTNLGVLTRLRAGASSGGGSSSSNAYPAQSMESYGFLTSTLRSHWSACLKVRSAQYARRVCMCV